MIINVTMIICALCYFSFSLYLMIKTKSKSIYISIVMLLLAYICVGNMHMNESIKHQEPYKAFMDKNTLVVLDSNKNAYVDSAYVGGKICIDVHTTQYASRLYGNFTTRTLNTKCQ